MEYFIAFSLVAMVLFLVYFMMQAKANFWMTMIVIPWFIFTMGFCWILYERAKGYATKLPIPHSQYLYAKVIGSEAYVLIMSDQGPRLHVMPATEQVKKMVQKGQRLVKQGKQIMIEGNGEANTPRLHEFDHKKQFPKPKKN